MRPSRYFAAAAEVQQEHQKRESRLLARIKELEAENEALRGLKPEIPERPPHNNDASYQHPALPRYGLRWNGPGQPVAVPMADGYWTPFHLALEAANPINAGRTSKGNP